MCNPLWVCTLVCWELNCKCHVKGYFYYCGSQGLDINITDLPLLTHYGRLGGKRANWFGFILTQLVQVPISGQPVVCDTLSEVSTALIHPVAASVCAAQPQAGTAQPFKPHSFGAAHSGGSTGSPSSGQAILHTTKH